MWKFGRRDQNGMGREGGKVEYEFGNGVIAHGLRRVGSSPEQGEWQRIRTEEAERSLNHSKTR